MSERPREYLGDGLYAAFDGYQIELRAPRENGDHVVYLEWPVYRELVRFAESVRCFQQQAPRGGS